MTFTNLGICDSNERNYAGSRERIIELYDHLRPPLHAYMCSLRLSKDHSEDVMQEAFLRLVRHFVEPGAGQNLRAWVFRVAHNLSMDFHRSERRWLHDNETEPYPVFRDRADPAPNPEQKIVLD